MTIDDSVIPRECGKFTVSAVSTLQDGNPNDIEFSRDLQQEAIHFKKLTPNNVYMLTDDPCKLATNRCVRLSLANQSVLPLDKTNRDIDAVNRITFDGQEPEINDRGTADIVMCNTDEENIIKPKRNKACAEKCRQCCKSIRLPRWLKRTLQFIYRWTGDPMTYIILFVLVYMTINSLQPDMAQLPECRRIAVPLASLSPAFNSNATEEVSIAGLSITVPSGYTVALECQKGDAFSVLVMYVFGFYVGQIMELIHLPGLLGMILGGLTLRNIGAAIAPHRIYHVGATPNASVPFVKLLGFGGEAPFDATDSLTQFAALLSVNPNLSAVLRQMVLATILTRAGLGINPTTLKRMCGSVVRLTFLPCLTEAAVLTIVSHFLIGWPWIWGAVLGFVIAAVSPSVVVPIMIRLEATGWGVAAGIPTLIVAASSLDDVLAITGFSVCLAVALSTGTNLVATIFWGPGQALIGVLFGAGVGSVLGIYPPARLEHSHTIRFMFVACLAVIGLLGSMRIMLPGAGALACLLSAFTIARVWRAGYPWNLLPIDDTEKEISTPSPLNITDVESAESNENVHRGATGGGNSSARTNSNQPYKPKSERQTYVSGDGNSSDVESDPNADAHNRTIPSTNRHRVRRQQRFHHDSNSSNILDTVVEYHPYNCSTFRSVAQVTPIRSYAISRPNESHQLNSEDVHNLSSALASVDMYGQSDTPYVPPLPEDTHSRPRRLRRFSLQEPTAPYDLESFSMTGSARVILATNSARTSERKSHGVQRWIDPLESPITFNGQSAASGNQPADQLKKRKKSFYENLSQRDRTTKKANKDHQSEKDNVKLNDASLSDTTVAPKTPQLPGSHSIAEGDLVIWTATPKERGEACLNLIRQSFAALWWFVQPILFTLIGAEVNLTIIKGSSVGLGVASLCIGIVLRMIASIIAVLPTKLKMKERIFISFSWLPKATVQAAIGSVALDTARQLNASPEIIGYAEMVLILAATAILMTAPVGAVLMRVTAPYLLVQDTNVNAKTTEDKQNESVVGNGKLQKTNTPNQSRMNEIMGENSDGAD